MKLTEQQEANAAGESMNDRAEKLLRRANLYIILAAIITICNLISWSWK